jgi:DNA-binding transcriptional MerR regulator
MTIGEVLGQLRGEFPDITVSKIRFLESEGLIEPARSPSGYRKFDRADLERLRFILSAQRDEYLPLRVIKQRLEAAEGRPGVPGGPRSGAPAQARSALRRGRRTTPRTLIATGSGREDAQGGAPGAAPSGGGRYRAAGAASSSGGWVDVRLTRQQLLDATGIEPERLAELEDFGLIRRNGGQYDGEALTIARTAMELGAFGFEARHLRVVKAAAERELGLIEQAIAPMLRQRGPGAHERAEEAAREIAMLSTRLHSALVSVGLRESLNG